MNHEKKQAILLEQYLDNLRHNPHTPPPPDLDAETASLARKLFAMQRPTPPDARLQDHLWRQLLAQPRSHDSVSDTPSPNGAYHEPFTHKETQAMLNAASSPILTPTRRWSWGESITVSAAVLALVLFGAFLLYSANSDDNLPPETGSNQNGLQLSATPLSTIPVTPTSTPAPTLISTGTPIPFDAGTSFPPGVIQMTPTIVPPGYPGNDMTMPQADFSLPPYQNEPEPIAVDETVSGTLTSEQPRYLYTFNINKGDLLAYSVTANGQIVVSHMLINIPQNNAGSSGGGGGGGGGGGSAPGESIELSGPLYAPQDSIVWFLVELADPQTTVEYELTLQNQPVQPIAYGDLITTATWDSTYLTQYFQFEGQRNDVISISVDSPIDTKLSLELLDGFVWRSDDDSGVGLNPEILSAFLPADGTYRIAVSAYSGIAIPSDMEYQLSLWLNEQPALDSGLVDLQLTLKQPVHIVTFEGQAGQTVRLTANTPYSASLIVIEALQNNQSLATMQLLPAFTSADTGVASTTNPDITVSREFVIPADGQVRITINADPALSNPAIMIENLATVQLTLETLSE